MRPIRKNNVVNFRQMETCRYDKGRYEKGTLSLHRLRTIQYM